MQYAAGSTCIKGIFIDRAQSRLFNIVYIYDVMIFLIKKNTKNTFSAWDNIRAKGHKRPLFAWNFSRFLAV